MCPFDPGKRGNLALIYWDDGPGTVVEVKEENMREKTKENEGTSTTAAAAAATAAAAAAGSGRVDFGMEHQLFRLIRGKQQAHQQQQQ